MSYSINLYNPALRKRKALFSALYMAQGLLIVFVGILALYAYTIDMEESLRRQEAEMGKVFNDSQSQFNLLASNLTGKTKKRNLSPEIATQESRLRNRRQLFLVLSGGISHNHGYSTYLRAFARQNLEGLWLTGFSIEGPGESLKIRGRTLHAELIPRYINRLSHESALHGQHFATLDMTRGTTGTAAPEGEPARQQTIDFTLTSMEGAKPE
ncbi:putative Fimbrial assembly protein [Gammaproteobacteria bacterium]